MELCKNKDKLFRYNNERKYMAINKTNPTINLYIKTDNDSVLKNLPTGYKELSYQQIIETYNTDIYWVASTEKQDQYLLNNLKIALSPLQRTILEKISYAGPIGIAQCIITQDLKLKPQTASHNLKKLQEHGLIMKSPTIYRGAYTNTCIHKRYSNDTPKTDDNNDKNNANDNDDELNPIDMDGSIRHDKTAKKMTQLLLQAKDNMMTLIDLIHLTGFTTKKHTKWARTFITKQHEDGNVEKVLNTANGKRTMCVKLIKPLSILSNKDDIEKSYLNHIQKSSQTQINQKLQHELTTNMVTLYIENAKEKGCTNKDLFHAFSGYTHANIREVVKKSINNTTITSIKELQGKSHVCRYFSKSGFEQYITLINLPNDTQINMLNNVEKNNSNEKTNVDDDVENKNNNDNIISTATTNNISSNLLKNSTNITSEYRKQALLTIIQRDQIRELNQRLIDEIKSMDKPGNAKRLDRRTVQRLIDNLEKQKKVFSLITSNTTFMGGKSNHSITLLIASNLENNNNLDQLVKEYLDKQQSNSILPDHRQPSNKSSLKEINTPVERYNSNQHHHPSYNIEASDHFWKYVAKRHGWIDSKWLRAKELHIYLYHLLLNNKKNHKSTINPDDQRQMSLANIMNMLPFDLFCKINGIQLHDNIIESYIENNNHDPSIPLYQLPHEVKIKLIPNVSRMRRRIQALLLILEQLELIEKKNIGYHSETSPSVKSNKYCYEIKLIGYIKNYKLPERPILMEAPLTTIQQVVDFWNELQYTCTCIYSTKPEEFKNNNNANPNDALTFITLARTWANGDMLTKEQKEKLDQHVNYIKGEVPKKDWQLILQLSRQTGLLPYRIRSYYINLSIAFDNRNKGKNQLSITSTLNSHKIHVNNSNSNRDDHNSDNHSSYALTVENPNKRKREMDETVQKLLETSKKKQRVIHISNHLRKNSFAFSKETGVGSRPLRIKPISSIDEPFITRDIEKNKQKKAIKQHFTESEHSIFIHATAIMQHRAQNSAFYWAPILTVLPEKAISQCRTYLQSLKAKSSPSIHEITELKHKWDIIYKQGIKNKDLVDERPWDTKKFNLPSYLTYFISHLLNENDNERIHPCKPLKKQIPYHSRDIQNLFHVIYKLSASVKMKKEYQPYMVSWTQNMLDLSSEHQYQYKFENLDIATTIYLIKMIMIEPNEMYDPHAAYNLLSQCSETNIEKAFNYFRDVGILVHSKHSKRYLAGRQFRMSNAFISALTGAFPIEFYDTAYHFHKQIENNQLLLQPLQNGHMAALLNLISERKITLKNTKYERIIKQRASIKHDFLYSDQIIKIWNNNNHKNLCIHIDDLELHKKSSFTSRNLERFSKLTSDQIKQHLNNYDKQQDLNATIVYNTLYQFGNQGANIMEIKIKLQNDNINISDNILIYTLNALTNNEPPLVITGGHDILKYICIEQVTTEYFLKYTSPQPSQSQSSKNVINGSNDYYLKASMWCMFDGKTNQNILYICATALLGYIVQQPGITNEKLFRIHKKTMSYVEFQQVLDHLLKNNIVISRSRIKESKPGLFTKPLLKFIDLNETISCNAITYYWASKDYYFVNEIKQ
ncbi:unnamed protein product [Cunninghamella blakesleeana]